MPTQHRGDVVVGSSGAGSQVDRGVSANTRRRGESGGCGANPFRTGGGIGTRRVGGDRWFEVSRGEQQREVHERRALERYLERMEQADAEDEIEIDNQAVAAALEKLRQQPEPEAQFMRTTVGKVPAYNVQTAVDAEHALIVTHQVSDEVNDSRSLQPMSEAAQAVLGGTGTALHVVADAGYSNGEQVEACENRGIIPQVPTLRSVNNRGDGTLFDRSQFQYDSVSDTFVCPAGARLYRHQRKDRCIVYAGQREVCGECALRSRCTVAPRRLLKRHRHDQALERTRQRATPEAMRLRRSLAEHPFATLKYQIFGHPRFLLRGLRGARTEMSLAVMAYNLKRMMRILGGSKLAAQLG